MQGNKEAQDENWRSKSHAPVVEGGSADIYIGDSSNERTVVCGCPREEVVGVKPKSGQTCVAVMQTGSNTCDTCNRLPAKDACNCDTDSLETLEISEYANHDSRDTHSQNIQEVDRLPTSGTQTRKNNCLSFVEEQITDEDEAAPVTEETTKCSEKRMELNGLPEDVRNLEALTCSVCLDLFFHPHGCEPCRHVFCDPCLRRLKSSTPLETFCPLCRSVILKCSPRDDLGEKIRHAFPTQYEIRHALERHRHLPSLPSSPSHSLRAFLRSQRRSRNNNTSTLTVIAQFAFFVLLVMFAFTIFATTVGYLLWYFLELFMDVTLDLVAAVNSFWDYLYQAIIVWTINGHIPPALKEMLSGSVIDMTNTYNKFSERMQELWNGGDHYRHQFMGHLRYHMTNGTNELLSKVKHAQVANYILLACLTTILLYKLARYVQRLQERIL